MASLEPRMISIRISIGAAKLEKLIELMPEFERDGQNTTPIYWAIDEAIRSVLSLKLQQLQQESRPNYSNRDYLRRQ